MRLRSLPTLTLMTLLLLLVASPTWTLQPKFQPPQVAVGLHQKEFFRPELYISMTHERLADIAGRLPHAAAWERFFQRYGRDFHVYIDPRSGTPSNIIGPIPMIPGTGVGNAVTLEDLSQVLGRPVSAVDDKVVADLIVKFIRDNQDVLGIDPDELGPVRAVQVTDSLWQVSISQQVGGVPVRHARIVATINHGNMVLFGTEAYGRVVGLGRFRTQPAETVRISASEALRRGFAYVGGQAPEDRLWKEPTLEFIPVAPPEYQAGDAFVGPVGLGYRHRLVWVFGFERPPDPARWEVLVDAHTGEVLAFQDTNLYVKKKVVGGVYPLTSTEVCPSADKCGTMQAGYPMPFANTGLPAPNNFTNSAGLFEYTSGTVTTTLSGKYVRISDACGSISESSSTGDVDLGGTNGQHDCTVPAGHSAGDTAAARSCFYEVNKLAEMARGWLPNNTWLRSQLLANVNINNTCNAFWNGTSINFYRSGGGCRNTGEIAAVFDHEWGHGLDDNDANGTISNSGEAYADIAAIYRLQTSCVGYGFFWTRDMGCGKTADGTGYNVNEAQVGSAHCALDCSGVRDADWAKHADQTPDTPQNFVCPKCSSGTGPCGRQVHCAAAPVRQAAWDLVARDLRAAPFNYDANTAFIIGNKLFYQGSGNVGTWHACSCTNKTSDGCGASNGYMQWLAADDDNGNLNDGTPHMTAIYNAFNRHNIACSTPTPRNSGCASGPTGAPSLTATPGDHQVGLSWTSVTNAAKYWVFRTEGHAGCNFGKTLIGTVTSTSFTDTEVANGRQYCYVVMAVGSSNACFGPASSCTCVTPSPGCTLPGTPTLVSPANGATGVSTTPTLDWSDVTGASSYDVQVCSDGACSNVVRSQTGLTASQWTVSPALSGATTYYWRARAVNSCGAGSWSATWSFTTASGGGGLTNRLRNPGFESGRVDWTEYSSGGYAIITNSTANPAHTGSWYAWEGGYNYATEYIYQDVTIPSNATQAFVQFWYRITTRETSTTICYDSLRVEVRRPSDNALLATLLTLCNYHKTSTYRQSSQLNVLNFRGQTIRLRFITQTDSSLPTSFFIDDVALMADGN